MDLGIFHGLSALITAMLSGGGVWLYLNKRADIRKDERERILALLIKQAESAQVAIAELQKDHAKCLQEAAGQGVRIEMLEQDALDKDIRIESLEKSAGGIRS